MIEPDPPMMQRMFKEPAGVVLYAEGVMLFIPLKGEQVMKLIIAEAKDQLQGNVITAGIRENE